MFRPRIADTTFKLGYYDDAYLVDHVEDGVDEHEVVLLEGQVAGVLEGEHHRPDQCDLGGARKRETWVGGQQVQKQHDVMLICSKVTGEEKKKKLINYNY